MNTPNAIEIIERQDRALRLILDVAQHEIPKFSESNTYDVCEKTVDDTEKALPELKKELRAVLYPIDNFDRYATDEEILTDLKSNPKTQVQVLTPEKLASWLNDDDAGFSEQWVRFINL